MGRTYNGRFFSPDEPKSGTGSLVTGLVMIPLWSIPVAGFVMTFDSVLFLTGVIRRDDLLYSEPEIDFTDEEAVSRLRREGEAS